MLSNCLPRSVSISQNPNPISQSEADQESHVETYLASTPVVIIHPSHLFADTLGHLLNNNPFKLECIATNADCVRFDALSETSLFIIGGRSPRHLSGLIRDIKWRLRPSKIAVIGDKVEFQVLTMMLRAGANGYLLEAMAARTLIMALKLILSEAIVLPAIATECLPGFRVGETAFEKPDADLPQLGATPKDYYLSGREAAILQGLIGGATNKAIARKLNIAEGTVKVYVRAVLRKIGVNNRTQAAVWAMKDSFVTSN